MMFGVTPGSEPKFSAENESRLYQALFDSVRDAILVADTNRTIVDCNQAFTDLFGYSLSEIKGKPTHYVYESKGEFEAMGECIRDHLNDPEFTQLVSYETQSGRIFPGETRVNYLQDEDGEIQGFIGMIRDVSEQKKPEETLERRQQVFGQLQSTTEKLLQADTEASVYDTIVEGMNEALAFEYIDVRQFDVEEGSLVPTAASPSPSLPTGTHPANDPGDDPLWQAFIEGETRLLRDLQEESHPTVPDTPISEVLAVPIENEGLILVGSKTEGRFKDTDIEMAELLSTNAKGILDRLHHEQKISELSHETSAKESRMKTIETWLEVIETIQTRLPEGETKRAIENPVCEELLEVGTIDFAWIGRPETIDTDLSKSEWAGQHQGYLDNVTFDTSNNPPPCQRAAMKRSPIAIPNIAEHVSSSDWAKTALSSGFYSVISIPIEYDDILYGVMTVYSQEQSAFTEWAESILNDIGLLLAEAYRRLNIRSVSSKADVVELEFTVRDETCPLLALARATEATIHYQTVFETRESGIKILVTVETGDVETVIDRGPSVLQIRDVERFGDPENRQVIIDITRPFIGESIADHGGKLVGTTSDPTSATMTIHQATNSPIRPLIEWITAQFEDIELVGKRSQQQPDAKDLTDAKTDLTERQYEVLKAAYHGGYFDTPKGVTGEEIAESFDISRPAIYNHLQAAHRRLLGRVFESGDGGKG